MTWARNLLFLALCGCGVLYLGTSLLSPDRIARPGSYDPGRAAKPDFAATVARVNEEFRQHWAAAGLAHADSAGELTICRRLSLGLTGTVPSFEEILAIEDQPEGKRVEWWLSRLLEDRRYADFVAERLARSYVGTENGPFLIYRRNRFHSWLSDALADNRPYDDIARDLIADQGVWTSNPAVNFLTVTADRDNANQPDPIRLAARVTRAFLGMRIDCLQCHDNNLPRDFDLGDEPNVHDGLQTDFHQLAAFFAQSRMALYGVRDDKAKKYEFQFLYDEQPVVVAPKTPYLADLEVEGRTSRERLANWVTHPENKPFARAMVNRVWALMTGRALIEPVDDIPLYGYEAADVVLVGSDTRWWNGEGRFPPGMEVLADDFIAHDYDLRRLIRLVAATEAFQLDSRSSEFQITPEHETKWAVFPLTRLRPEQVAGSLIQASVLTTIDANAHIFSQLQRYFQVNDFVRRYGDIGEDEFVEQAGTIPQRLLMLNGNLVQEHIQQNVVNNAAARIAVLAPTNEQAVETAYLAVLTRRPSSKELEHFSQQIGRDNGRDRMRHLEDIYWVLLNSTEFSWNH